MGQKALFRFVFDLISKHPPELQHRHGTPLCLLVSTSHFSAVHNIGEAPVSSVLDKSFPWIPGVHFGSWILVTLPPVALSFLPRRGGGDNSQRYFLFVGDRVVVVQVDGGVVMAAALLSDGGRGGGVGDCGHGVEGDETHENDHQRDDVESRELGQEQEREGQLDLVAFVDLQRIQ